MCFGESAIWLSNLPNLAAEANLTEDSEVWW